MKWSQLALTIQIIHKTPAYIRLIVHGSHLTVPLVLSNRLSAIDAHNSLGATKAANDYKK